MGYGVTAYAVPVSARGVLGSNDAALVRRLVKKHARRIQENRETFDDLEVTLDAALEQLVAGAPLRPGYADQYTYAFEFICRHVGGFLPNSAWDACPSLVSWTERVDDALLAAGVDPAVFSVAGHLTYRSVPPLPPTDDYPNLGHLRLEELPAVARALDAADLSGADPEVRESIDQVIDWVTECVNSGCDLVCFSY